MVKTSSTLLVAATACIAIAGVVTAGEISTFNQPQGEIVTPQADLQASCWQDGTQIFARDRLAGIDIGSATREQTLSLKRANQPGSDTIIVPLGRTVCIVTTAE